MATTPGNAINETTTGICGFTGTAFTGTPVTNHSLILGAATSSTLTNLGVASNGQLPIGSTGADPTLGLPTSTGGAYIAGAGTLKYIPANFIPGASNIGIAYSSPTFTVQGYDGTALSATNPGYVTLPSKANPGRFVTITVTANQTFTDGSTGTTDNARFGLTTGVSWSQDIPFFLYGVMDDTESLINFMISRNPAATTSPVSTSISKSGSIINVGQGDFFSLDNITVTSYDSNPCIVLGSFRMQFLGATDSWAVTALANTDGIGNFNEATIFTLPTGVNGAAASTYILSNAGTEPQFTNNDMLYSISRDGWVKYKFDGRTASVAGVGSNTLQPICPYAVATGWTQAIPGMVSYSVNATGVSVVARSNQASGSFALADMKVTGTASLILNSSIALNDTLQFFVHYKAY